MAHPEKHPMLAYRDARGLSQEEAAARVGCTQEMWSQIETRRRYASPRLARRIAEEVGMALEDLLNFGDEDLGRRVERPAPADTENPK